MKHDHSDFALPRFLMIGAALSTVAGCTTYPGCMDKGAFTGTVAVYSLKPDHKALYQLINRPDLATEHSFMSTYVWGRSTASKAQADALQACENFKSQYKLPKADCFPVAIDNKQTVFNPTSYYCGATQESSVRDQADFLNALTNLSNSIKK